MTLNLEDAIKQQINLGRKNPHEFYDVLVHQLGDDLFEIARPYLADFINEMARHELGNVRRSAVAKINPKTLADPEVLLKSLWVPGNGKLDYKPIGQMTADDFDARADYLERMTAGIQRSADWCRTVANDIRAAGVKTAGKLKTLPALPEPE